MRTDVHIVARFGRSPRIRSSGGLAVRQTGTDALHLISTAATPLGGDHVDITVEVEEGARLRLSTVAATIALPSLTERTSTMDWTVLVGAGADLAITPLPTIVAADADLVTSTTVRADPTSSVLIDERVQLGRHDEDGGRWQGRLYVDVDDLPALRHRLVLDSDGNPATSGERAVLSAFRYPDTDPAAVSERMIAARLRLDCGGSLTTVLGRSLTQIEQGVTDLS
ncbi:urease accessory protein UreD [Williamsia maris]|uniref:Urease accessory protein n=1 Tax=Williamsia maris TaxID=72806 RepID=A0ABT1HJ47_9NOCA|nr:urease accessory protein UreD [Williamsia maris]MCP2177944.1 urease accessory protein [Williamsia maris]